MIDVVLELPIPIGVLELAELRVTEEDSGSRGLAACAAAYRGQHAGAATPGPGAVEGVDHARRLFRALGIDPTRRRPSSEALLRRAIKGGPLPRINTLVDVGNWCSLDFLLPLGIYDADRIDGAITLRRGRPGERYLAVSGRDINLGDRYVLADGQGAFGSPMTDSVRTSVSTATTSAVILMYAPADYPHDRLHAQTETMASRVVACCGGKATRVEVVHDAP